LNLLGLFIHYYSALRPVLAGTRIQSGDQYGSGTLHPGQILRGSLSLLSPRLLDIPEFLKRPIFVKIRQVEAGFFHAHRQTERQSKARLKVALQNFGNAPKKINVRSQAVTPKILHGQLIAFMSFVWISVKTATFTT
jgi:hypothetical protein